LFKKLATFFRGRGYILACVVYYCAADWKACFCKVNLCSYGWQTVGFIITLIVPYRLHLNSEVHRRVIVE